MKSLYVHQHATRMAFTASESWVILSPIEQSIRRKIEAVGTPLKEWDISIYRGVLTGYNEAFIISTAYNPPNEMSEISKRNVRRMGRQHLIFRTFHF